MAAHDLTTPTPLPVIPRPLVIGHVLTPEELAGLLRIGDALAAISERLAAVMGRPGGPLAGELADLAAVTLHLLDIVEGDPEAEPDMDGEPSLGWSTTGATGTHDASPFLLDLEEDIADELHDPDQPEEWVQPARLDVFPPLFIGERTHG